MERLQSIEHIRIGKLMPLIGHLTCFMRQQTSQIYADLGYDVTPEAAQALLIIQHFDGLPQKKLADILGKDKASITRLLNSLVKYQLVERVQDEQDRRIIRAHITEEGKLIFEKIMPKLGALSDLALNHVSESEFDHMIQTMTTIIANVSQPCCAKD
jgi:DNA-binding MarR family transcriptional regulator